MLTKLFKLLLISLNTRGQSIQVKRRSQYQWIRDNKIDIAFLQETHSTFETEKIWTKEWSGNFAAFAHGDSKSRGVAILIRQGLDFQHIETHKDENGRWILVKAQICNQKIIFLNIYAPNDTQNQIQFYTEIAQLIQTHSSKDFSLLIGGDFNVVLDPKRDKKGGQDTARKTVIQIIFSILEENSLDEVWRTKNPNKIEFTWPTWQKPKVQSRLDMWLIPSDWLQIVKKIKIVTAIETDHRAVILSVQGEGYVPRGPGIWKLNNSVLQEEPYQEQIREVIQNEINIARENDDDPRVVWDSLKYQIKIATIEYCTQRAQNRRKKEKAIAQEIEALDRQVAEWSENQSNSYQKLKEALENLYQERAKGAIIRTKARWIQLGEQNSKYFYQLERRNFTMQCVYQLKENGQDVFDMQEINYIIKEYYQTLYKNQEKNLGLSKFAQFFQPERCLTDDERVQLDRPITKQECKNALDKMPLTKTPGKDGLTVEFYKTFWEDLSEWLIMVYDCSLEAEELPLTQYAGIIRQIPKLGKDSLDKKNWRPITLLNVDYKILSKVLAERLKIIIPNLISQDQCGFVDKRYIGENIRLLLDLMEHMDKHNMHGILVSLDIEKAFDTLAHNFVIQALEAFGFGSEFIKWMKIFQLNGNSQIINNGYLTDGFHLERGVRQGDPISGYIFILAIELLSNAIRKTENIKGIQIGNVELKLSQFADDTTVTVSNRESIIYLWEILDLFAECSGLKVNKEKTQAMGLGTWKSTNQIIHNLKVQQEPIKILGIWFSHDKKVMHDRNVQGKVERMKNSLAIWNSTGLTLQGRIMIVKTLGLSQLVYPMINLHVPKQTLKEIDKFVYKFIWNGTAAKIKKSVLVGDYFDGGLKAPCIFTTYKRLKCSWIRRITEAKHNAKWNIFLGIQTKKIGGINYLLSTNYEITKLKCKLPHFYSEVLEIYSNILKLQNEPQDVHIILAQTINNNRFITRDKKSIFINELKEKKIDKIYTWISNGNFRTLEQLQRTYNTTFSWLTYNQIVSAIPREWKRKIRDNPRANPDLKWANLYLTPLDKNQIKIRTTKYYEFSALKKWREKGFEKSRDQWSKLFQLARVTTKETKLRIFQYRLMHRIIPTGQKLYQYKIRESPECHVCGQDQKGQIIVDDISHSFLLCPQVNSFWTVLSQMFEINYDFTTIIDHEYCVFGVPTRLPELRKWNYLAVNARYYIYNTRREQRNLSIQEFLNTFKTKLKAWIIISHPSQTIEKEWKAYL